MVPETVRREDLNLWWETSPKTVLGVGDGCHVGTFLLETKFSMRKESNSEPLDTISDDQLGSSVQFSNSFVWGLRSQGPESLDLMFRTSFVVDVLTDTPCFLPRSSGVSTVTVRSPESPSVGEVTQTSPSSPTYPHLNSSTIKRHTYKVKFKDRSRNKLNENGGSK